MNSKRLKTVGLLALIVAFTFTMAACDMGSDEDIADVDEDAQGIEVAINAEEAVEIMGESGEVGIQTIEDTIVDPELVVTLYYSDNGNNEEVSSERFERGPGDDEFQFGEEKTILFEDLEAVEYDVEAKIKGYLPDDDPNNDGDEIRILYGPEEDTEIQVEPDDVEEVDLDKLMPNPWEEIVVNVNDKSDRDVEDELEDITLKHPSLEHTATIEDEPPVTFGDNEFSEAKRVPARWHVELNFGEAYGSPDAVEVLLLPTEEEDITIDIDYEDGDIEATVDIHKSPEAPHSVEFDYDTNELDWEHEDEGEVTFTILRSEESDEGDVEYFEPVAEEEESPFDGELEEGYYYWVRAYDDEGYSSDAVGTDDKYGEQTVENEEELESALTQESVNTILLEENGNPYVGSFDVVNSQTIRAAADHEPTLELKEDNTNAIFYVQAEGVTIEDLNFVRKSGDDVSQAIRVEESNVAIQDNKFRGDATKGVTVQDDDDAASDTTNVDIVGNEFDGFRGNIALWPALESPEGGDGEIADVTIYDNTYDYKLAAIHTAEFDGTIEDLNIEDEDVEVMTSGEAGFVNFVDDGVKVESHSEEDTAAFFVKEDINIGLSEEDNPFLEMTLKTEETNEDEDLNYDEGEEAYPELSDDELVAWATVLIDVDGHGWVKALVNNSTEYHGVDLEADVAEKEDAYIEDDEGDFLHDSWTDLLDAIEHDLDVDAEGDIIAIGASNGGILAETATVIELGYEEITHDLRTLLD